VTIGAIAALRGGARIVAVPGVAIGIAEGTDGNRVEFLAIAPR
jgi:hypothetical protein